VGLGKGYDSMGVKGWGAGSRGQARERIQRSAGVELGKHVNRIACWYQVVKCFVAKGKN
jgi:hypothetical protein